MSIDGHEDVLVNDGAALKKSLARQPVAVAICASPALQLYSSGIVNDKACCQQLNHGVLVVGYRSQEGVGEGKKPYWVVKNS